MMSTASPFSPIDVPIVGSIALKESPISTPAAAPRAEASITVNVMIRPVLIPRRPAVSAFSEVARIALPTFVRFSMTVRRTMSTTAVPKLIIWIPEILKTPISISSLPNADGNERVCGPQTISATLSRNVDTPIVLISGARCVALCLRSGRSASSSSPYPRTAPPIMAPANAGKIFIPASVTRSRPI